MSGINDIRPLRCEWSPIGDVFWRIDIWWNNQHATIECDGEHLVPQTLSKWYYRDSYHDMDDVERVKVINAVVSFIKKEGKSPTIVLVTDKPGLTQWTKLMESLADEDLTIRKWSKLTLEREKYRLWCDHTPFGRALMKNVADDLIAGMCIRYAHRDYCGHGLFFREGKFILSLVDSGEAWNTLAEWPDMSAFVAFFSQQSDYSCSGADVNSTLFNTTDVWSMGNQRLTRERLESERSVDVDR